jgi:TetR/AcrR family transcriptional regulator, transcriptional repressor for nem operon
MATGTNIAKEGRSKRDAIIDAAAQLMALKGYNATSVDDVLRETTVGKGNFYYYFKSKEELGYAILDRLVGRFVERTLEPSFCDPDLSRVGQIHCFLDHIVDAQRELNCVGGCPMGNLASELSDLHEGFRARLARMFTLWRERLAQAITEGQQRGEVSPQCAPAAVAQFLVAALEGAILMTKVTKEITVMEECVGELKRYLSLYDQRGR